MADSISCKIFLNDVRCKEYGGDFCYLWSRTFCLAGVLENMVRGAHETPKGSSGRRCRTIQSEKDSADCKLPKIVRYFLIKYAIICKVSAKKLIFFRCLCLDS